MATSEEWIRPDLLPFMKPQSRWIVKFILPDGLLKLIPLTDWFDTSKEILMVDDPYLTTVGTVLNTIWSHNRQSLSYCWAEIEFSREDGVKLSSTEQRHETFIHHHEHAVLAVNTNQHVLQLMVHLPEFASKPLVKPSSPVNLPSREHPGDKDDDTDIQDTSTDQTLLLPSTQVAAQPHGDVEDFVRSADFSWTIHFDDHGLESTFSRDLPLTMWYDLATEYFCKNSCDPEQEAINFLSSAMENNDSRFLIDRCHDVEFQKINGATLRLQEDWYFYIHQKSRFQDTHENPVHVVLPQRSASLMTSREPQDSTRRVSRQGLPVDLNTRSTDRQRVPPHSSIDCPGEPYSSPSRDQYTNTRRRFSFARTPRRNYLADGGQTPTGTSWTCPTTNQ